MGRLVVDRFTELVQQDHANEMKETSAKFVVDTEEEAVEKGFSGALYSLPSSVVRKR